MLGSTVAIMVAFVFPPLMYMKTLDMTRTLDPQQTTLLIATPAPGRPRSYTEDLVELEYEDKKKSKCLPTLLCIMGVVMAVVCTSASAYNIVTPKTHGSRKPGSMCYVNHTAGKNHTNHTSVAHEYFKYAGV